MKPFGIPIIRVNVSDVESVTKVNKLVVRYWQKFGKDILVDMIGYRKYGHNEVDEPAFTQPQMYEKIRSLKSLPTAYGEQLIQTGVIKADKVQQIIEKTGSYFEEEFKASEAYKPAIGQVKDPNFKGSRSLTHKWAEMDFS